MQRGRILKDTNNGAGVISANANQYKFELAQWKSDLPPKVGAVVDIVFDDNSHIKEIYLVDENTIAKEQAEKALLIAKEKGKVLAEVAGKKSMNLLDGLMQKMGKFSMISFTLLFISWIFLPFVSVQAWFVDSSMSLYDIIKTYSSFLSFLLIISLAAVPLANFINHRFSNLLYTAPFIFIITSLVYYGIKTTYEISKYGNFFGGKSGNLISGILFEVLKPINLGIGFYISIPCVLFLAYIGIKRQLVASY